MTVYEYIIGAILIVFSLIIIVVVLMQEGNQSNLGVISGAADTFMDKGKARSWDQRLAKWTKVIAIAFFVLVFLGMLTTKFLSPSALQKNNSSSGSATTSEDTSASSEVSDDSSEVSGAVDSAAE